MPRLSQVIATEKGIKTSSYSQFTELHKKLQKTSLLSGITRTYRAKDDEGDVLPPESTRVQVRANAAIRDISEILSGLFDVTATKDFGNCEARADVTVNGQVILENVPVPG